MKAPLLFCLLFTLPMTGIRADQSADFTKGNTRDLAGAGAAGKDVGAGRTASGTRPSDPQGNKQEPASLLPEGWDPALAGDRVLERLIKVTAPQVKGAHDAEFVCVGDRAYVVSEVNDVRGGESGDWPFIYSTMSIVNLATLKTERVVDFARGEQVFSNATLPAGACWVPRILQKDADTLRCYFVSQAPGHRQSQMWYRDFDLKRGEFNPAIFRAKLKTATGVHDFQPQHFYADAAAQGFAKKASDSFFFLFDSFKRFDGRLYVALNNFTGRQNALALVHDDLETFEVLGHYNEPQTQALSESAVNRLPDGTWMAICRNDKGNYHFATSPDGRQWGVAREMPFVKNGLNSKPTFDTFGGVYYLGWQENTRIQGANRSVFNVDISRDGVHWERKYRFETPRSFQYPTFHEHEGSVWLCVTQGDTDDSRKERIMFGKLEAVGGFESQKDQRRSVVNPVPTGGPSVIVDPGAAFQNDVRSGAMVIGMDRTPKGRLWGCWTGTGDKRDGYFLLATSDDGGTSWSRPRMAVGAKTDASQQMHGALVGNLWTDPKGRLWLFFDQQLGDPEKRITNWYLRCDNPDAAEPTWSAPVQFAEGCTLNKPVVLKNGEWLLPVSDWKQKTARVFVSGDEGVSWKERGNLQFPDWEFDEHMMVERKDGQLWMLARTKGQPHESFSSDSGRTWTAPQQAGTLQNINARFFLRRLQSGRLLLVKNGPINQRLPRRSSLSAYLSDDDGKTWSQGLLLDDRAEVSYPDGFEAPDGLIHILYDWNRHTDAEILMAKFRDEDVIAGKIVSQDTKMRMLVNKALAPHLPPSITPDPKWTAQGMEDAKQDFKSIPYDGVTPNKMVCDTTLRELPDGSWILFMLAGGDTEPSPLNYTGVTRSVDQGKTWKPLERFDVGFPREGKTIGQGPTELMILGQRSTLFFSTHSKHWANDWRSWFLTSDDSFRTWTKPQEVPGRLKERTFIRKHIVTRDGRIVIPFQHYVGPESEQDKAPLDRAFTNPRNGVLISSDGGATWTEHGNIRLTPNDRYFGWAENDLFEHPDGRITMIIRADGLGGLLFKAESKDGGKTWPEFASITAIPNPGSKATLYNLGGDCVAILHNPNSKQRSPMALWISFDGMKSWPYQRVLQAESCDGPKRAMNYPDGFVSKDRQWLHFAFDDNRHRAVHYSAKLPPLP